MKYFFQQEKFIITCILIAVICIAFYDIVFFNKTFKVATANPQALMTGVYGQENNRPKFFPVHSTTTSFMEEPIFEFIRHWLSKGEFPLWNPHQGCGYPLISMMHLGFFWPVNWIMFFLPSFIAWDLVILLRFLLAGIFTYWFMRYMRFSKAPSLTAAIIFMLSGPMVLLQYTFANVDILTPLILISFERLLRKPTLRCACITSLAIAATVFAGHPEHIVLVNFFALLFFLFRLLTGKDFPSRFKSIGLLGLSFVLGIGLSSVAFWPFLRDWKAVFWHTHPDTMGAHVGGTEFLRDFLLSVISPHFFQKHPVTMDFVRHTFWGHIGVIPLGLVFIGLFSKQRKGLNWFFAFLFFAIMAKTYINLPVINWIGYLPILKHIRFSFHTGHLFGFAGAIAAGMGMRCVINSKRKSFLLGLLFVFLCILWLGEGLWFHRNAGHIAQSKKACLFAGGLAIIFLTYLFLKDRRLLPKSILAPILIGLVFAEMFCYLPRANIKRFDSFPSVPYIENLKRPPQRQRAYGIFWTLYPNTATGYHLDDLGLNQGLITTRFVRFVNQLLVKDYFNKDFGRSAFMVIPASFYPNIRPFMDLLNVRFTIGPNKIEDLFPATRNPDFPKPVYKDEVAIYEHPSTLPRTFIVHKAVFESDPENTFAKLQLLKNNLSEVAVIEGELPEDQTNLLRSAPNRDNSYAFIHSYKPNEVIIAALVENPGLLIFGDTYHPDWRCTVNGRDAKVYPTNYLLRGVFLLPGKNIVHFKFKPVGFYFGAFLSLFTLSILGILFFYPQLKPREDIV